MLDRTKFINAKKEVLERMLPIIKDMAIFFIYVSLFFYVIFYISNAGDLLRNDRSFKIIMHAFINTNFMYPIILLLSALNTLVYCGNEFFLTIKILKNSENNFYNVNILLGNNFPYTFYLREFASGKNSKPTFEIIGDTHSVSFLYGNNRAEIISKDFVKHLPLVYLFDVNEQTNSIKGYFVLSKQEDWFLNFKAIAEKAKYIVCDYADRFSNTKNIVDELNFILSMRKRNVILFCTKEQHLLIKKKWPLFLDCVLYMNIIYYIKNDKDLAHVAPKEAAAGTMQYYKNSYWIEIDKELLDIIKC